MTLGRKLTLALVCVGLQAVTAAGHADSLAPTLLCHSVAESLVIGVHLGTKNSVTLIRDRRECPLTGVSGKYLPDSKHDGCASLLTGALSSLGLPQRVDQVRVPRPILEGALQGEIELGVTPLQDNGSNEEVRNLRLLCTALD